MISTAKYVARAGNLCCVVRTTCYVNLSLSVYLIHDFIELFTDVGCLTVFYAFVIWLSVRHQDVRIRVDVMLVFKEIVGKRFVLLGTFKNKYDLK